MCDTCNLFLKFCNDTTSELNTFIQRFSNKIFDMTDNSNTHATGIQITPPEKVTHSKTENGNQIKLFMVDDDAVILNYSKLNFLKMQILRLRPILRANFVLKT